MKAKEFNLSSDSLMQEGNHTGSIEIEVGRSENKSCQLMKCLGV